MADAFLSQDEVDALLLGVAGPTDAPAAPASDARPYDLATQERIVRGRMPTLELINERFARLLRIGLYNFLRRTVEINVGPVRVIKYSEFIRNLVVPTNLNLMQMKPLRGTALIVFDPKLVFMLVENLFGGNGKFHTRVEGRDFSDTEQRIIERVLAIVSENYGHSWQSVHPITLEYMRSEINTQFVNIATPNEVVVCTSFAIELGNSSGEMHFCTPYSMIEPVRDALASSMQGEALELDQRWSRLLTQQIKTAEVELVAQLGRATATFRQLLEFQPGDIIPLAVPPQIEVTVNNVPVMECSYGKLNNRYALKVEKMIAPQNLEALSGKKP